MEPSERDVERARQIMGDGHPRDSATTFEVAAALAEVRAEREAEIERLRGLLREAHDLLKKWREDGFTCEWCDEVEDGKEAECQYHAGLVPLIAKIEAELSGRAATPKLAEEPCRECGGRGKERGPDRGRFIMCLACRGTGKASSPAGEETPKYVCPMIRPGGTPKTCGMCRKMASDSPGRCDCCSAELILRPGGDPPTSLGDAK